MIKANIRGKIIGQDFVKHEVTIKPDNKFNKIMLEHGKVLLIPKMNFLELYDNVYAKIKELKKKGIEEKTARKKAWKKTHKEIFG